MRKQRSNPELQKMDRQTSVTHKLIAGAVAFLAEPAERGETHELKTLFEILDERLALDALAICSLSSINGQRYFSRAALKPRKLGNATVFLAATDTAYR